MKQISYEQAGNDAIKDEFRRNPKTVHMSTDLPEDLCLEFGADRIRMTAQSSTCGWPPLVLWRWTSCVTMPPK
jgi:hypothetical protein